MLCNLLGDLRDGILAVGLDDGVGKAVLHDKTFEILCPMFCWPCLGRDDRSAQAGDGLHHGEDGDVGFFSERCRLGMRVAHETVVQLNCAMLMLMPTTLSTGPLRPFD